MLDDIERYWSRELQEEVEVLHQAPDEYALYIGGTYIETFRSLGEVEDYLNVHMIVLPDRE